MKLFLVYDRCEIYLLVPCSRYLVRVIYKLLLTSKYIYVVLYNSKYYTNYLLLWLVYFLFWVVLLPPLCTTHKFISHSHSLQLANSCTYLFHMMKMYFIFALIKSKPLSMLSLLIYDLFYNVRLK